ncbi:conserved hypothetical protein [Ricinus communis]|uniref:Uncharacterized protein n=1 Tax=Ricinus communis TaxID=3988 RepID=B9T8L1_RICCO|nr:conserved hypothetical protein [Ricinus communis]
MGRAEVNVVADLMRMHCAQMAITGLAGPRLEVTLEATRRLAAVDRAAVHTLAAARADDS